MERQLYNSDHPCAGKMTLRTFVTDKTTCLAPLYLIYNSMVFRVRPFQYKVDGRFILNVVGGEGYFVFELFVLGDKSLLVATIYVRARC
jgi:hypothetical protein